MTDAASPNPASALPTSWNPQEIEPGLYDGWVNAGYFTPDASSGKTPYSVVLPPPNVTGQLHMGHALNQTIIDVLTRRKRMQGYEVLWLPGTDHAGIATQTKVEAQLIEESGLTRHDLGRDGFLDKVWEWKDSYHARITGQIRSLGAGVDWSRERFTLDEGLSRAVQTIFKQLFDAGMIYRAERLVNWSPTLKTAISDIEVDYKDVDGELVSIRYGSLDDAEPHVIVATTRVETMLGDVAVAVHPEDERYTDLIGTRLPHPFIADRTMIVVADDYVDPEFGTGAVKITPAHDPNDFELGRRHNLPMPTIMDAAGAIADTGTQFDGLDRFEARVKIREALAAQGRIVKEIRPYNHSVGHSDRSGEPIEPRLSLQWWVDVQKLAAYSAAAVREGDTAIHPAAQEPRWFDWVDDMHDWTISRQLWWGHRIPIYYGPDGEVICCGPDEQPPAGYVQDSDVLDTWFSSALFPFSTMGWPEKTEDLATFYPTSVLVTGYDILFFWVARMMMFGTFVATQEGWLNDAGRPIPPFTDVLLHGMVRDEFGQKMSKSKGNGIDPLDWVETYGTDALRFTLARGANPGADLNVGTDYAESSRNFVTKLFNATKFALLNGAHVGELPPREELTDADRWILDELESVRAQVDGAFDNYELAKACQALYRFAWDEFCDWYLEIAKAQLPGREDTPDAAGLQRAEHTRIVLGRVLDTVMRLLAPVMPFVTEVLWQAVAGPERDTESLVIAEWPSASHTNNGAATDERAAARIADLKHLVTEIRRFRNDQGVKPSQKVPARFGGEAGDGLTTADLAALEPVIASLVRLEQPDAEFSPSASIEVRLSQATIVVELDTSGTVDLAAERKRLDKDLAAAEKELAGTTAKLGNEAFLAKAPDHVVEKIRTRKQVAEEEIARITARLAQLQG